MNAAFVILKDMSGFQMAVVALLMISLIFGLSAFAKWIKKVASKKTSVGKILGTNSHQPSSEHKNKTLEHIIDNQELINGK